MKILQMALAAQEGDKQMFFCSSSIFPARYLDKKTWKYYIKKYLYTNMHGSLICAIWQLKPHQSKGMYECVCVSVCLCECEFVCEGYM